MTGNGDRHAMRVRRGRAIARIAVIGAALAAGQLLGSMSAVAAAKEDRVFTIGNYPVEARSTDAVTAKNQAIAEGQQAALRSLLRRIVPVSAYNRIGRLKSVKAADLIDGLAVRSERNSSTEYIASYDFSFQAEAIRRLLDKEGIPFLDRQAPQVTLVPIYKAPADAGTPEVFTDARGSDAWLYAWKSLDLQNSLTPVSLQAMKKSVNPDTVKAILEGAPAPISTMGRQYETETLLIAVMEPDLPTKKVHVTLAGRDAVAPFVLKRSYRLDGPDLAYTAELAAVLALGILEGRWKAINVRGGGELARDASRIGPGSDESDGRRRDRGRADEEPGSSGGSNVFGSTGGASSGSGAAPGEASGGGMVRIAVQFNGMGEWTQISRQLSAVPDVSELDVLGLGGRSARVQLRYPGGAQQLALALASQGLILRNTSSGWVLTQR